MDANQDRCCEACGTDWRGSQYCPICGRLDNVDLIVTACAWCPTHAAIVADAHAQGMTVTSGMCARCAVAWERAS